MAPHRLRRLKWHNRYITHALRLRPPEEQAPEGEPHRGIGFEEARELFSQPYWLDQRSDVPEQYGPSAGLDGRLYSLVFEVREDEEGEILHLITLWRSTKEEVRL